MDLLWMNDQIKTKNEVVHKATVLKLKKVSDYMHYDPYLPVDNCYDLFLLFAKLKLWDVCVYFIKSKKYNNRYFSNGKSTLYYLITTIQNVKLLYEVFIYWKWNSADFELFEKYHPVENYYDILLYYYLNNNVCPCVIFKDAEIIKNCLLFKKFKHLCNDCLNVFINSNHSCSIQKLESVTQNPEIVKYCCLHLNCNNCLNHFVSINQLPLKRKLVISKKTKTWNAVIYSATKLQCVGGDFEDSIDIDNIQPNEKYYKCTSSIPHYFKYENWILWSNQKNTPFYDSCCICKLKMDCNLYINHTGETEEIYYNNRSVNKSCNIHNKKILSNEQLFYYLE